MTFSFIRLVALPVTQQTALKRYGIVVTPELEKT